MIAFLAELPHIDTYLYDAWGSLLSSSGTTVNPFRWVGNVGYYFDAPSGLYYIRARVYQPTIARWTSVDPLFYMLAKAGRFSSRDPVGYVEGSNLFAYLSTGVLFEIDPTGLLRTQILGDDKKSSDGKQPVFIGIRNNCKDCCCCPISMTVSTSRERSRIGQRGYAMGIHITFEVTVKFSPIPKDAKKVSCSLSFAEWLTPASTHGAPNTPKGEWVDRGAQESFLFPEFKKWRNWDPPEGKDCSGEAKETFTDRPQALLNAGGLMEFYQWVAVTGGADCKCKPVGRGVVTHVKFKPPGVPTVSWVPGYEGNTILPPAAQPKPLVPVQ